MDPLDLTRLTPLMQHSSGSPEITVGVIDGPVLMSHPELAGRKVREIEGKTRAACSRSSSAACTHGTFVLGILAARRGSAAPAICPDCVLLIRPIFPEAVATNETAPSATPEELAEAVIDCVDAGARVLNLSAAIAHPSPRGESQLEEALNHTARRGVILVAAAGNQGTLNSSAITRHSWVIPVAACNMQGRPLRESNLGSSIGRRGLRAPGENITSLGTNGKPQISGGTSAAAPFVTGAIALLWSEFPGASAAQVKLALMGAGGPGRRALVPPLLDALAAYQRLTPAHQGRGVS